MKELPKDIARELERFSESDEWLIEFRKEPWSLYKRNRWVILTNKRIYLVKKIFFGLSFDTIQILLAMAHFEMVEGIVFDTIYLRVTSEPEHIIQFFPMDRESTLEFFDKMEKTRDATPEKQREEKEAAHIELEALAKTFYENAITREEYEEKKKGLIDKL